MFRGFVALTFLASAILVILARVDEDSVCFTGRAAVLEDWRVGGRGGGVAAFAGGDGASGGGAAAAVSREPGGADDYFEPQHSAGAEDALSGDCRGRDIRGRAVLLCG